MAGSVTRHSKKIGLDAVLALGTPKAYLLKGAYTVALTGTFATNGTTSIVGTGSLATTELHHGDTIFIQGEAAGLTVDVITDNTHFTVKTAATTTASGKTGTAFDATTPKFVSDLGSNILATVTLTNVTTNQPADGTFDCDDIAWAAVTGAFGGFCIGVDTGTGSTSPLIYFNPDTPIGSLGSSATVTETIDNGVNRLFGPA